MPSRSGIPLLSGKDSVTAEDINILYRLVGGLFDSQKGHGMAIKFTAFDGQLPTGLVDTANYALEIRNREPTRQKAFAVRNASNKVIVACEDGVLKAVKDNLSATTPTQVIVQGTPAGGILSGTFPNPGGTEYSQLYPTMCLLWFGSNLTSVRDDLHGGTNVEVLVCPGWVFCSGQTVKMRDGSTLVVPNMADRLPIGVGAVAKGATAGNPWSGASTLSIAHTHSVVMSAHVHNVQHTHLHAHSSSSLVAADHLHGTGSYATVDHAHGAAGLFTVDHLHSNGSLVAASHVHGSFSLTVTGTSGISATVGGSVQSGSGSSADPVGHTHNVGSYDVGGTTDGSGSVSVTGFTGASDRSLSLVGSTAGSDRTLSLVGASGAADRSLVVTGAVTSDATAASVVNSGGGAPDQTSGPASVGTVNVQNPVVGWYYIMKL
jgi:hypothetical protein